LAGDISTDFLQIAHRIKEKGAKSSPLPQSAQFHGGAVNFRGIA